MAWTDYLTTTTSIAGYVAVILIFFVVFGLLGWWLYRLLKYNKRVIVRTIVEGGGVLIQTDFAKEYRDKKSGSYMWRLKKRKHALPRPNQKAISLTNRGKEWVELYYTGQGQYVPAIAANGEFADMKDFIKSFQPITESQRMAYTDQLEKAEGYKTKGIMELLSQYSGAITLIIMLAVILTLFGEAMNPILELNSQSAGIADKMDAISQNFLEASRNMAGNRVIGGTPETVREELNSTSPG